MLSARLYRKIVALLDGRGLLFAIADDVKIIGPPNVIVEVVTAFPELAWSEAGLRTQSAKGRIYVPPSAREGWNACLASTIPMPSAALCVYDIPDGSLPSPEPQSSAFAPRIWSNDDGINILGTPLGSKEFVQSYLDDKLTKHRKLLLHFI